MTIRIEDGPKAGYEGKVKTVTGATQFETNFEITIIDFEDGTRSTRHRTSPVTILDPQLLPSGEFNPYPAEDGSCSWCDGKEGHKKGCPLWIQPEGRLT